MDKFRFMKDNFKDGFKDGFKAKSKYPVFSTCPVCHNDLFVSQLTCDHCDTVIDGKFTLSKFNYLETQQLYFIEVFVKNRGNIKAVEKEMDISYPTVKKLLDDVIQGLGYTPDQAAPIIEEPTPEPETPETPKLSKMEIIEKIQKGEITVTEAAELLKKIKR